MIYLIGKPTEQMPDFQVGVFEEFEGWMEGRREVEFDIETTVSKWWCDKQVITVQFGDMRNQWVLQWSELSAGQKETIKGYLESDRLLKLIHNAMFECVVMLFHGIRIQSVFDTMLAEQVLYGGEHDLVSYGLDDICWRRLGVELDKSYQTAFGDNILTPGKIVYAAQDVRYLTLLKKEIYQECQQVGLEWVVALENESLLGFAEMTYHGMGMDQEWWMGLAEEAEPLVAEAQDKLNAWLRAEEFGSLAYDLGYLSDEDRLLVNWKSPVHKKKVFEELYPQLPGTTKAVLKKWQSDQLKAKQPVPEWLPFYLDNDFSEVTQELLTQHRQWLIDSDLLIPANTPTINWNSVPQVLPVFQWVDKKVKNLNAETMGRVSHPIGLDYEEFKDTLKLVSSFGERFLEKYVDPDGKIRTTYNQVMTTGRISSKEPNCQNIPAKETVGNKYRNAFVLPEGYSFVSSDYTSQELVTIAYLSKDPVWMEALSKGQDLHSVCAELVYGKKWKDTAERDCAYYKMVVGADGKLVMAKKKCECKKHKYLRSGIKSINFGLAYGMSHFKLASMLRITVPEAKQLIIDYFKAFPNISRLLDFLGRFGLENGYIKTIYPFYRRRWFPYWKFYTRFIDGHIAQAQYHPGLGEIERASKNMPIQGSCANMTKVAICFIYWHIHDNHLEDRVTMRMQVHDQIDCGVHDDYTEEWAPIQTRLMEEAAKVIIPTGILKAETTITKRWSK